jgi:hypothetical protein
MDDIYSDELAAIANPDTTYVIYTLIDITDSKVISPKNNALGFHQAQNLNTFIQTLSLRTQLLSVNVSINHDVTYADYGFDFPGQGTVWGLTFVAEATDPWLHANNQLHWITHDFSGTPVHTRLRETVKIYPEIVNTLATANSQINTRFNLL